MSEFDALVEELAEETREYVKEVTDPIVAHCKRIDALETAIAAFQSAVDELRKVAPVPGPKGDPGDRGDKGDGGEKGDKGDVGERGEAGIQGAPGDAGSQGSTGADGVRGDPGERGEKGEPGINGKDADEDAIIARVVSLIPPPEPGKPGADGANGKDGVGIAGKDGRDGINGKDGESIHPDTVALMVREAVEFAVEKAFAGVKVPENGAPGRDAMDVDYADLDANPTRSYSRGTHARFKGGIVRARRVTDPVADDIVASGWDVLVEGFPVFRVEHDGRRQFEIVATRTSGAVERIPFTVPVMLDAGVWKREAYAKGDCVSWGGSIFIAQRDTTAEEQPECCDAWRLAVKRGRDKS